METQELINLFKGLNTNFVYYDGSEESVKALEKLFHAYYSNKDDSGKLLYLTHSQPHSYYNGTTCVGVGDFAFQGYSNEWNFGRKVFSSDELISFAESIKYNKEMNRYEICFLMNLQDRLRDLLNILGIEAKYRHSENELDIAYYKTNMWNINNPTDEFYNNYRWCYIHEGDIITIDATTKEYSVIYKDNFAYYYETYREVYEEEPYYSYAVITLEYKDMIFKFRLKRTEEGKYVFRGCRLNNSHEHSVKKLNFEADIKEYKAHSHDYIRTFLKDFCEKVDNNEVDIEYYDSEQFKLNL